MTTQDRDSTGTRTGMPLGFHRSVDDRVVAGVAGGIGERLGVDPVFVRVSFVALSFAGGAGIILYLLGWIVSEELPEDAIRRTVRDPNLQQAVALGMIVLGLLLLLRNAGLWLGDTLVWPIVVAAFGSAVMWTRGSADDRARWSRLAARIPGNPVDSIFGGRVSVMRLVIGGVLIAAGMAAFLAANDALHALRPAGLALGVALFGAVLVFGPWVWRLLDELSTERRERIRSEERAEVAAHLHDSVLQTLALIQRSADQPRRMVSLARRQERELRTWLYGQRAGLGAEDLRTAFDATAEEIEAQHDVSVEVVVVGEVPLDDDLRAVVGAAREAMVNAAKHAGVSEVSLFVEVGPDEITAFVRDRGAGFDPAAVPPDRRGIMESIVGRMTRHGGSAEILSEPGAGTEVVLTLPRRRRQRPGEPSEETA